MSKSCLLIGSLLVAWVSSALAIDIPVATSLVVSVPVAEGWTVHRDPPVELVRETARCIAHNRAAAQATPEQIENLARRRLLANEAIVYHVATGAHLDVDFSPLGADELPPSRETVRRSADYAAHSLEGEADVSALTWEVAPFAMTGASEAFLLRARYMQHERPMQQLAVVGYVEGFWFFLYGTVPGEDPRAMTEMRAMLEQVVVQRPEG